MPAARSCLGEALTLSLGDNDRFMLNDLLEEHDALQARIASYTRKIDEQLTPWDEQLRLLTTIPGVGRTAASTILIEIGPDIEVFASKERFAAWAGLCPGNNESGGKRRKTRTRRGSKTLRATLVECAHGAARTKGCQFEAHHRALAARRGYKRAIVAGAPSCAASDSPFISARSPATVGISCSQSRRALRWNASACPAVSA